MWRPESVAQRLEQLIESGEMPPGCRLDNEIALADQLGLSRPTMRHAIQHLVDKGLLVRKRGVGTHVARARVQQTASLLPARAMPQVLRSAVQKTVSFLPALPSAALASPMRKDLPLEKSGRWQCRQKP